MDDKTKVPRVFFIHVMKNGGTSFSDALSAIFQPGDFYPSRRHGNATRLAQKIFVQHLIDLDPEERKRVRFYSVHFPAWTATEFAGEYLTCSVLRDPVERTMSHLRHIATIDGYSDDIEELYDDPLLRGCLSNYQTRVFGERREQRQGRAGLSRRGGETVDPETAAAAFQDAMRLTWTTGFPVAREVGTDDLAQAVSMVESLDEVGTVDQLDLLVDRVSRRLGRELGPIKHLNASDRRLDGSAELRARIRADTLLDAELYERARDLAASRA